MRDFNKARENMVKSQLMAEGVESPRLLAAFREIPRERFMPKAHFCRAYAESPVVIDECSFLLSPAAQAKLLQIADVKETDNVLIVGNGTGYVAALVSRLSAFVVMLNEQMLEKVSTRLHELGCDNVLVVEGDLLEGCKEHGPYDKILLNGWAEEVPETLLKQLSDGGRLVTVSGDDTPRVKIVTCVKNKYETHTGDFFPAPKLVCFQKAPKFRL